MTKPDATSDTKPNSVEAQPRAMRQPAPMVATAPADPLDEAAQRQNVCDFIRQMSAELSVLAHKNGFEALAMILENARQVAEAAARPRDNK